MRLLLATHSVSKVVVLCVAIMLLNTNAPNAESMQSNMMTGDLVVTVHSFHENSDGDRQQYETIGIVDTDTRDVSVFYEDSSTIYLRPLSWSPDGRLLAILRIHDELALDDEGEPMMNSARTSICIVNESGVLQTCLESPTTPYWYIAPAYIDHDIYTTWSEDSRYIYFVSDGYDTISLVEADVTTGETVRTLFETGRATENDLYNVIVWSADLTYVATGVAFHDVSGEVINLSTGESYALDAIVKPYDGFRDSAPENGGYVCQSFSDSGYLTAIDESTPAIIIFAPDLIIYQIIDDFNIPSPAYVSCPVWSDNYLYFTVFNQENFTNIFYRYSLVDQTLDTRFVNVIYAPFTVSPDETRVAYGLRGVMRLVKLKSGAKSYIYDYPEHTYSYPVWKPDIIESE